MTDDDLRERYAKAAAEWALMYPISSWALADGEKAERLAKTWGEQIARFLFEAVRDEEMERLRSEVERLTVVGNRWKQRAEEAEAERDALREQVEDERERARQAEEDEFVAENRAKRAEAAIEQVRFRLGQSIFHPPECLGRLAGDNPDCTMCGIIRDLNETAQQQEDTDD